MFSTKSFTRMRSLRCSVICQRIVVVSSFDNHRTLTRWVSEDSWELNFLHSQNLITQVNAVNVKLVHRIVSRQRRTTNESSIIVEVDFKCAKRREDERKNWRVENSLKLFMWEIKFASDSFFSSLCRVPLSAWRTRANFGSSSLYRIHEYEMNCKTEESGGRQRWRKNNKTNRSGDGGEWKKK